MGNPIRIPGPPMFMASPEAADRAISRVDISVLELGLAEIRVAPTAEVIRLAWEDTLVSQGTEFPSLYREPDSSGKQVRRRDPLMTGIVFWERTNDRSLHEQVVTQDTIQEILGLIPSEEVLADELRLAEVYKSLKDSRK